MMSKETNGPTTCKWSDALGIGGRDAAIFRQTLQGFGGVLPRQNSQLKKSAWTLIFLAAVLAMAIALVFAGCGSPTGGGGDSVLDKTALEAKIAEAEDLQTQAVPNAAENVPKDKHWVTQEEMTAFEVAIIAAKSALASATTQAELDKAVTDLKTAITNFNGAWKPGTKESDPGTDTQTPAATDYSFGNLNQALTQAGNNIIAVTITANTGKSPGEVGNVRYAGNTAIPQTAGTYAVTFDVAAATGWKAATGLSAGNLTVNAVGDTTQTPVAGDYTVGNLNQTLTQAGNNIIAVTITAISGKSSGAVNNIRYAGNTTIPQTAGTYAVSFDVVAAEGWKAATGLSAGNLIVSAANQTPAATDYSFDKLNQTLTQAGNNIIAVTITANSGKSPGVVGNIRYAGNTAIPQTAGTYAVTFDVAAAAGWNAATGLSAGNLTVHAVGDTNQTPVAGDYTVGNLNQTVGSITAVTVEPKDGKSTGTITIYYNGLTVLPTAAGTYTVTFDVAATEGWNKATGLSAGNLTVNSVPVAADFEIGNLTQTVGSITAVTVEPKAGKSTGTITIYYNGLTVLPTAAGTYAVTFDVAAATYWNEATGLSAGNLVVTNQTPVAGDYTFGNLNQTAGSVTAVTITVNSGKSSGARTIYYEGTSGTTYIKSTTIPQAAGTYAVIFDVAAATYWNEATGLSAGNLVVTNQNPIAGDYTFGNLSQTAGSVTAVTITVEDGKSPGLVSNILYAGSTTIPQTAGTYAVTFDVAAATGWNEATGLSAGTLIVNSVPVATDYEFGNLSQTAGSVTAVSITPGAGKSSGARTIYYEGVSPTSYTKSTTIPQTAGTYAVTFDVAAATGWNAATNLSAGNLVVTVRQSAPFEINLDAGPAITGPTITGPTISLSGDNGPKTATLSVTNPGQYSSIIWYITGTNITTRGNSITLDSANTAYNKIGKHSITVEVVKSGVPYNTTVTFTVVE